MANSFNNMNLTNQLKELVSRNRTRYIQDGFNLDLTYITDHIIAMGYPASKIEGVYRNHIDDVVDLLDKKHMDHYYIYNLCSERSYNPGKFHDRVKVYPFDDHNPPRIDLIELFCRDVHEWLGKHERNVAAVHCKAGKGRTGTMICCYLLYSRVFESADEALSFYGKMRTQDQKGVTIPSQVRYVGYYGRIVKGVAYRPVRLYISEVTLEPPPTFTGGGQTGVYVAVTQGKSSMSKEEPHSTKSKLYDIKRGGEGKIVVRFDLCFPVLGDVRVELFSKSKLKMQKVKKQFQFWFNTFFVEEERRPPDGVAGGTGGGGNGCIDQNGGCAANSSDGPLVLTLNKSELDIVSKKDKQNKNFSQDFKVTLRFNRVPEESGQWLSPLQGDASPLTQDSHSGGSSESDISDDEEDGSEWESGESVPFVKVGSGGGGGCGGDGGAFERAYPRPCGRIHRPLRRPPSSLSSTSSAKKKTRGYEKFPFL